MKGICCSLVQGTFLNIWIALFSQVASLVSEKYGLKLEKEQGVMELLLCFAWCFQGQAVLIIILSSAVHYLHICSALLRFAYSYFCAIVWLQMHRACLMLSCVYSTNDSSGVFHEGENVPVLSGTAFICHLHKWQANKRNTLLFSYFFSPPPLLCRHYSPLFSSVQK